MSGVQAEVDRVLRMVWQEASRAGAGADTRDGRQWLTYARNRILTLIEQERYLAAPAAPREEG